MPQATCGQCVDAGRSQNGHPWPGLTSLQLCIVEGTKRWLLVCQWYAGPHTTAPPERLPSGHGTACADR